MLPGTLITEDVVKFPLDSRLQLDNIPVDTIDSSVVFDVWRNGKLGEVSAGDVLYCLLVGESRQPISHVNFRHGLVLKNVTSNTYTRVGTTNIIWIEEDLFLNIPISTINLI
jgi:hypothetical protein